MSTEKKTILAITISRFITGGILAALTDTLKVPPFAGVAVEDIIMLENFPTNVGSGSITVTNNNERVHATQAKITSTNAITIALKALPGTVVEVKLDNEAELKIDAGNGYLLAVKNE